MDITNEDPADLKKQTAKIFTMLQTDRLGGLMSLDPFLLLIELITVLPLLALHVALKEEALLSLLNGTAWMVFTVFIGLSGLISS